MTQIINLRAGEYNNTSSRYMELHETAKTVLSRIISDYRENISADGCFFADSTSDMLSGILDLLESEIMMLIEESFTTGEQGISNMIDTIVITDSAC